MRVMGEGGQVLTSRDVSSLAIDSLCVQSKAKCCGCVFLLRLRAQKRSVFGKYVGRCAEESRGQVGRGTGGDREGL